MSCIGRRIAAVAALIWYNLIYIYIFFFWLAMDSIPSSSDCFRLILQVNFISICIIGWNVLRKNMQFNKVVKKTGRYLDRYWFGSVTKCYQNLIGIANLSSSVVVSAKYSYSFSYHKVFLLYNMLSNYKGSLLFLENKVTPFGSAVSDLKVCPTFGNLVGYDHVIVRQVFKRCYCHVKINL